MEDEDERKEMRLTSRFLLSASNCVKNISSNSLRCHLNIHWKNMLYRSGSLVEDRKMKMCEYCQVPLCHAGFSLKVLPRVKPGKKMKKILKMKEGNKNLAIVQEKLASIARSGNTLALKCQICNKVTTVKFDKKQELQTRPQKNKPTETFASIETNGVTGDEMMKKKKKESKKKSKSKRRKALYCGLNPKVVASFKSVKKTQDVVGKVESDKVLNKNDDDPIANVENRNNSNEDEVTIVAESKLASFKMSSEGIKSSARLGESFDLDVDGSKPKNGRTLAAAAEKIIANRCQMIPLGLSPVRKRLPARKKHTENPKRRNKICVKDEPEKMRKVKVMDIQKRNIKQESPGPFISPYAIKASIKSSAKKLNKLQMLIEEEEKKPVISASLVDFLSTL